MIRFNQDFDPTETLMAIAKDPERIKAILAAPDQLVPLSYILEDLRPRIGFLPIDPENPGLVLIAEFMLNELILKYSESLEKLDLVHLKELFSGDDAFAHDRFAARFERRSMPADCGGELRTGEEGDCCLGVEHPRLSDKDALWERYSAAFGSAGVNVGLLTHKTSNRGMDLR